jgi:hypothetical protein
LIRSGSRPPEESKQSKNDVKKVLCKSFATNDKITKIASLASSFDNKESYKHNYSTREKQDREIEDFQIVYKGGNKLETKEIKYFFTRKGIHVYDFNEKGNYQNGFNSGTLSFKVRKNEDPSYNSKLREINEKIDKLGMKLVQFKKNTKKPITDLNPTRTSNAKNEVSHKIQQERRTIKPAE